MLLACHPGPGFCGGDGGHASDHIKKLETMDARMFAWCILTAEGMAETFEYETTWRPYFERMFRDVFGDGEISLEAVGTG